MAHRRYLYRVTLSSGKKLSNPEWSLKNAESHARFALMAGAKGACIERAIKFPGQRIGYFEKVKCVRKRRRR